MGAGTPAVAAAACTPGRQRPGRLRRRHSGHSFTTGLFRPNCRRRPASNKGVGEQIPKAEAPPRPTNVIDLMEALQSSVEQVRGNKGAATTAVRKKAPKRARRPPASAARRRRDQKRGRKVARSSDLDQLSKVELYQRAADIPGRSSMTREELVTGLDAAAADEGSGKRRRRARWGGAQPVEGPVGPDEGAALPVGQQRVVVQRVRRGEGCGAHVGGASCRQPAR